MGHAPRLTLASTVLDTPDPRTLAAFYQQLLDWTVVRDEPDWVRLEPSGGGAGLAFQTEPAYVRPVWPAGRDDPPMMMHLDVLVEDLEAATAHAMSLGALLADFQPQDDVHVMLDPDGHPFCLFER